MTDTLNRPFSTAPEGPIPPQALEAERSVLAAMMLDHEAVGRAVEMLAPETFYRLSHQKVFEAILALYESNTKADLVSLGEKLRERGDLEAVGGTAALTQILDYATTSANLEHHARIIQSKWVLRSLIKASGVIQQEAYAAEDDTANILDRAESRIFEITDKRVRQGFVALRDLLKPSFEHMQRLYERARAQGGSRVLVTGVGSGYDKLDAMTAGFQAGDLIVVAGRPSMGKTSFCINVAENAAIPHVPDRPPIPVAIFSLEMSKEQLVQRMLSSQSEVGLHKIRNGFLDQEDWPRLIDAAGLLTRAPIVIDDSAQLTTMEIRAKCRRLRAENRLGLVIIDYLQLIRSSGQAENRVQEISAITRNLKALAKELEVPIIALSQLSRAVETRDKTGRPQLSDLRESGSIEQDSDLVMFVYREVVYKPDTPEPMKAQILVAKQRNGPTGEVDLTFLRDCTKFVEYYAAAPGETEPPVTGAPF